MKWKKIFKHGSDWKSVELSENEIISYCKNLLSKNSEILEACINKANQMVDSNKSLQVALALFDKCGIAFYTGLAAELDQRVEDVKFPPQTRDKIKEMEEAKREALLSKI